MLLGQSVALADPSGCGKSTIMQLPLRFYMLKNTRLGIILFNEIDANKLNPVSYWQDIALVHQGGDWKNPNEPIAVTF